MLASVAEEARHWAASAGIHEAAIPDGWIDRAVERARAAGLIG